MWSTVSVYSRVFFSFADLTGPYKNRIHNQALADPMPYSTEIGSTNNSSIVTGQDNRQCG